MTLSDALALYLAEATDLAPSTQKRLRYDVNRWLRLGGPSDVSLIDKPACVAVRLARGDLSPWSIEGTISTVLLLLKHARRNGAKLRVPYAGRRLRRPRRLRYVPPLADLARLYEAAEHAHYPVRSYCSPRDWWRAFLVTSYTTGLRLSDLIRTLKWEHVKHDRFLLTAAKTSKIQALPLLPCTMLALNRIRSTRERIFSVNPVSLREQMTALCHHAGVPRFLPQAIRRLAANEYERARPGAGSVLLGHSLTGATSFYVSCPTILLDAAAKLDIPPQFNVGQPLEALA
jgi:site-specific recombinase XerC